MARRVPAKLADWVAPPRCAACDERLGHPTVFCPTCFEAVVPCRPLQSLVPLVAYGAYGGPLADAVHRFKYQNRPDLAQPLGELLSSALAAAAAKGCSSSLVVPVPLHPMRLAERGYNQAALLAARLPNAGTFAPRALVRARHTPPQTGLDRVRRQSNLRDAFAVRAPHRVADQRIVLVDDVITTGATMRACADALYRAGAASVLALAVARVE
jgi:ComF family protein